MREAFVYTTPLDPRARPLLDELAFEYDSRYGDVLREPGEPREMERYPAHLFAPPHGNFVLLLRDGVAVGGGAFMRHDERTAELKRMWTHSALRRQGLASKVLLELEAQVRRQGYERIYLTTGFRQPEAVGLYLGHGYTALFDPPEDPETPRKLPFEKQLQLARPSARIVPQQAEAVQR
ncbi:MULTISPECIES: GNAT family N-acetyltransferase [unclassified Variovorax]|uniref:GNAT family N-acetyltransferase n=1 Tax=unclassified Variovorax TaxID=663243 RepID=UPI00257814B4|nr:MULTISPECIES: GNAT family N-acetyltransferase [unclassified Variovorax]MDM0089414.1 GNAT family N-acetyltransferase [Variovorax sp. J22G40]MDM0147486.1 GNAT family N-acetyltransferase [Variovorax sp. J2P1-31]